MNEINDTTSLQGNEVPPRQSGPTGTPTLSFAPTDKILQRKNGKLAGVAGGLADYFNIDVTIVRLAIVALTLLAGPPIPLAYLVAWIVIPDEGAQQSPTSVATITPPASNDESKVPVSTTV